MERQTFLIGLLVTLGALLLGGVVVITLWQTGVLWPAPSTTEKNSEDRSPTPSPPAPTHHERNHQKAQSSSTAAVPPEVDFQTTLQAWLSPTSPSDPSTLVSVPSGDIAWSDWLHTRERLPVPADVVVPGSGFGYSMDSEAQVLVVGAPGLSRVYLYLAPLGKVSQTLEQSTESRFGRQCHLSHTAMTLVVQSDSQVHIYRRDDVDRPYILQQSLALGGEYQVLGVTSDTCLWISDQARGLLDIYECQESCWLPVKQAAFLAMDLSYEVTTGHVWLVGATGLHHWSRDTRGLWTENAHWMGDMPLTTIHQFGGDSLILGEAHQDTITWVKTNNPMLALDGVEMPGGPQQALFGDRVLWWDAQQLLFVTIPYASVNRVNQCGAVMVYKQTPDARLCPQRLIRTPGEEKPLAQLGSHICLYDAQTLLLAASGAEEVWVLRAKAPSLRGIASSRVENRVQ